MSEDDAAAAAQELEALQAIYGDDAGDAPVRLEIASPSEWRFRLGADSILEVFVPRDYPSLQAPTPVLHAPRLGDRASALVDQLLELYEGAEVVFAWVELLRQELTAVEEAVAADAEAAAAAEVAEASADASAPGCCGSPGRCHSRRVRHVGSAPDDPRWRVCVTSGPPFHPPKSGPGETMQAHVASVTCIEQVSWVLSHLLSDRKIAAASHNMVAYSFVDASSGVRVFDNDDDGEGGSGAKLASTIDNKGARDVIVVVSRWFGGVHLGPARFKHIASVAGALLEEQGYCRGRTGGASRSNKKGA